MPVIAEKYTNRYAFTVPTETVGPIRVWRFKAEQVVWEFELKSRLSKDGSVATFIRAFISVAAKHLNPEREEQAGELITSEEADKLTEDELEMIAGETIKHHTYLFEDRCKTSFTPHKNDKGEELVDVSPEKIDIPRSNLESNGDYLKRLILLLVEREKEEAKLLQEMLKQTLSNWGGHNSGLLSSVKESLARMDSTPIFVPPHDPQRRTNEILYDVLEELADQKEINKQLVKSIDEGGQEASRLARWSIAIAILSALIALGSWLYTYYHDKAVKQASPPISAPSLPENPQGEVK